ncbi:MAG: hypothetical protein GY842_00680 [bacterium]|nr:hypothetical protein [bacterium]
MNSNRQAFGDSESHISHSTLEALKARGPSSCRPLVMAAEVLALPRATLRSSYRGGSLVYFILAALLPCQLALAQWISLPSGVTDDLFGVHFVDEQTGFAVGWGTGSGGVILRTTDGSTWTSTRPVAGAYLMDVDFATSTTGFVAAFDAAPTYGAMILRTTDSGSSWAPTFFVDSYGLYVVDFPTSEIGYACGFLGAIYKTIDTGASWSRLTTGTSVTFRVMHFVDESTGHAVGGTDYNLPDRVYRTTNGGGNWSLVHDFGGSAVVGGIYFFDSDIGIIVGNNGNEAVLKSHDGGSTWQVKHTGAISHFLKELHCQGDSCWAVGSSGRILRSTDVGETWTLNGTTDPPTLLRAVSQSGSASYVAGNSGAIFKRAVGIFSDGFESGATSNWSTTIPEQGRPASRKLTALAHSSNEK